MINKNMTSKTDKIKTKPIPNKKPNELGGFYFSSHIKIFDPNTKEILVKKRGDL